MWALTSPSPPLSLQQEVTVVAVLVVVAFVLTVWVLRALHLRRRSGPLLLQLLFSELTFRVVVYV
ncbi:hypothetical protein D918_00358 [Trichuris suis]|nr:hypothetical protein D918_00358 [Trichuris suis]